MRPLHCAIASISLALLFTSSVAAQPPRNPDRDERYHSFGRETMERVREDLVRAERDMGGYIGEGELRRFTQIRTDLNEFQRRWERGRYDRPALDAAVEGLQRLVTRGRLRPRDRDLLVDDLRRLRGMRERIERGGGGPRP